MRVEEAICGFEIYLLSEQGLARNTTNSYLGDLRQLQIFLNRRKVLDLQLVTTEVLKDYFKYLRGQKQVGARSLARKISTLKSFFKYLVQRHGVFDQTVGLVFPKLRQQLPRFLSETEVQSLLKKSAEDQTALGIRNHIMLVLLYVTGIRISELIEIRLPAIRFEDGLIAVQGKGDKQRLVPVTAEIVEMVREKYLKDIRPQLLEGHLSDYLFPAVHNGRVGRLTRQSFWLILKKLALKSGVERQLSPHVLRHSLATHLLKNGANLRLLQVLLGHERLTTVQIYTHVDVDYLRNVYDDKHPRSQ